SKFARSDQLFQPVNHGMVFQQMTDHELAVKLVGQFDEFFGLAHIEGKRLLHKNVAAGEQGLLGVLVMGHRRRGDGDRVNVMAKKLFERIHRSYARPAAPSLISPFLIQVKTRYQLASLQFGKVTGEVPTPSSQAHCSNSHLLLLRKIDYAANGSLLFLGEMPVLKSVPRTRAGGRRRGVGREGTMKLTSTSRCEMTVRRTFILLRPTARERRTMGTSVTV